VDGSALERLEDIKDRLVTIAGYTDLEIAAIKAVTDALPDSGAMTTLAAALEAVDDMIDGAALEKLTGAADGADVFPAAVVNDSVVAKMISKANPAAASSFNNTTDSLEALSDKLGTPTGADIATDLANIQTEVDKIGTPAADLAADIAAIKLQTDEIGAAVGASLSVDIAAVKTEVDKVGVIVNAGGTATIGGVFGDFANSPLVTRLGNIQTEADKIGVPAGASVSADILAAKTALDNFAAGGGDGKALVRKTVTFSNTAADVNLFTVTGGVEYTLFAFCTTNLESAAGCNIGVDHNTAVVIADTDATAIEASDIWHDATPDASLELASVAAKRLAYGGTIALDVETAKQVDSGVLVFVCIYTPLTSDGAVAAAA
jgi:hypothetical protein